MEGNESYYRSLSQQQAMGSWNLLGSATGTSYPQLRPPPPTELKKAEEVKPNALLLLEEVATADDNYTKRIKND